MKRFAIAALVVSFANVAHAEPSAKQEPDPDEIADVESREANLEPTLATAQRKGLALSVAVGGGIIVGGDIGVGRGPSFSMRLGHVATRKTNITFELTRSDGLHKATMSGPTLYDLNFGFLAGAQRYTSRSFWLRAASGLTTFVQNATNPSGTGGDSPRVGVGGLVGAGLDIVRRGYLVLGLESFGMASLSGDGLKMQLSFGLGLSYY